MNPQKKFHDHLFDLLQDVEYVQLNVATLSNQEEYDFLINKERLMATVEQFKNIPTISSLQLSTSFRESLAAFSLQDGKEIIVHFVHKLMHKALSLINEEEMLTRRVCNAKGVYVPSVEHHFTYVVLKNLLDQRGLTKREFDYFNEFHILIQEDLLEYFNNTYGTTFASLYELSDYDAEQRQRVLKRLKTAPANRFLKTINMRWSSLLGYMKQARII